MKLMKKILAISLVLIMAFSVIGCHKKDEIAVTVNGFDYTSAYYMCALINAYNDGTSQVQAALGDKANADTDIHFLYAPGYSAISPIELPAAKITKPPSIGEFSPPALATK